MRLLDPDAADNTLWEPSTIAVDDIPTDFELASWVDGWAAVGRGPRSILAIAACRVPSTGIALVRLDDMPQPRLRPHWSRPPRQRRFPDEYLRLAPLPDSEQNLHLSYSKGRLTGTVAAELVNLALDVPHSHSRATGVFAAAEMSASWRLDYSSDEPPTIRGNLHGRFGDQTVTLTCEFHLDAGYAIESGQVTGQIAGNEIAGRVEGLDGGLCDTNTVAIDGTFADLAVSLFATISGSRMSGKIIGTVDNAPLRIEATKTGDRTITILTGTYPGPHALLAVTAGTLLWFL